MSGVNGIGGGGGVSQVIALRQQIIDRSSLLQELHQAKQAVGSAEPAVAGSRLDDKGKCAARPLPRR